MTAPCGLVKEQVCSAALTVQSSVAARWKKCRVHAGSNEYCIQLTNQDKLEPYCVLLPKQVVQNLADGVCYDGKGPHEDLHKPR